MIGRFGLAIDNRFWRVVELYTANWLCRLERRMKEICVVLVLKGREKKDMGALD